LKRTDMLIYILELGRTDYYEKTSNTVTRICQYGTGLKLPFNY